MHSSWNNVSLNKILMSLMDPEVSVLLHCAIWRGLLQSQVQAELSERFNRQTNGALELHIEEVWAERVSKEPWLFNGAKFRLHSFNFASPDQPTSLSCRSGDGSYHTSKKEHLVDAQVPTRTGALQTCFESSNTEAPVQHQPTLWLPAGEQQDGVLVNASPRLPVDLGRKSERRAPGHLLTLRLGLTCYKDFLGTNWSDQVEDLRTHGEAVFGDPLALLAQPLGVGGVLCTQDGQVVLIRRSHKVAEARGLLDIPGGHPEPKVVCHGLGEEQVCVAELQQRRGAVVTEVFSSVCAEIRDEVNVPLSSLAEPVLLGIALNHTSAGRPSAEFYISCSLTSAEVRELYWRGGAEAHESTDIVFLSKTDILELDMKAPLWSEMCPSAKGAVLLYQLVMPN